MTDYYKESEATEDRKQVDAFLSGIDVHLNDTQRALDHVIMSADFHESFNLFDAFSERRSYPYRRNTKEDFRVLRGKEREKALKKRAKDKSNRKKARRN